MGEKRATVWILGDQLLEVHPALEAARDRHEPGRIGVVMVESRARARRRPYHRKKLVLLFSAMRHYARRLEQQGYAVDYRRTETTAEGLLAHVRDWESEALYTMAASEIGGRWFQSEALQAAVGVPVDILPNTQFLTGRFNPYPERDPEKRTIMEYFYRRMRAHFDLLMDEEGEPEGGNWNYDKQNREPLPEDLPLPDVPGFQPDSITLEAMEEVEALEGALGEVAGFNLAVTHGDARAALDDFLENRLKYFGPYEDAMTGRHQTLFHSQLSPYLNLGLLEPLPLARAAESAFNQGKVPINSAEGFIRQVVGWREFIYWQYWRSMPGLDQANAWEAQRSLPAMFWDARTEMNCLKHAFERVQASGYLHHIERLMLICNFALLAGLQPKEVNDWFLSSFIDAYEWVMYPNVMGMGLNADGGQIATKPYIASAAYINRMSDYCQACGYHPKKRSGEGACPFNLLYWNFLLQHEDHLRANPRLGPNVLGLRHLDEEERSRVREGAGAFLESIKP